MSSKVDAEKAINEKWKQVKNVVGDKSRDIQSSGHGGWIQICWNGYIYWHRNTGAHEVHGDILTSYLKQGGPGPNRKTGRRELGYPTSDVLYDRYPISRFEWGSITWVDGNGDSIINGDLYSYWIKNLEKLESLGNPITSQVRVDDGETIFFEFGCIYSGQASGNKPIYCSLDLPRIGQPQIAGTSHREKLRINNAIWLKGLSKFIGSKTQLQNVIGRIWEGCLAMRRTTNKNSATIGLALSRGGISATWHISADESLSNRTLYDIILTIPGYEPVVLVAHAVYAKESWKSFGFIHSSDLHVNRRTEKFRKDLELLGAKTGAKEFVNYNNGLREMIRNANKLYKQGKLDMILATGDLIDYVYEEYDSVHPYGHFIDSKPQQPQNQIVFVEGDTPHHSGNFTILELLLRGQVNYPNGARAEELMVPIFMTPGNHDYRIHPYRLLFNLNIPLYPDREISHYASYNLSRREVLKLEGRKTKPTLHRYHAREMVKVDKDNQELRKRIVRDSFYIIRIGPHRIVMIDSRWDAGILTGDMEAIVTAAGYGSDDQRNFADGGPNSEGFTRRYNENLKWALKKAKGEGIFIVGMHAPPINLVKHDHSHFLRETERPFTSADEIKAYLRRHASYTKALLTPYMGWEYPSEWLDKEVGYFKKGDIRGLDYSISSGEVSDFLNICVGKDGQYPIDLVLCGHTHNNVEYRLKYDEEEEKILFYMDFYTENPKEYYPTKHGDSDEPIHVSVKAGAKVNGRPARVTDSKKNYKYKIISVPPYNYTLNDSRQPNEWWRTHRPLIMQTASVGPLDKYQRVTGTKPKVSFRGYRFFTVENNVITTAEHVTISENTIVAEQWLEPILNIMMDTTRKKWLEPILNIMMDTTMER